LNEEIDEARDLLDMTTHIVATYVTNNKIASDALPGLISSIHTALTAAGSEPAEEAEAVQQMTPARARKLITPSGIVSMIDGREFKTMKRHIGVHGYTPESYRAAFGLPLDFPMVHPDYSASRSNLAKKIGLGQGGRNPKAAVKPGRKAKAG
jgi:predicted transcriptional regulator